MAAFVRAPVPRCPNVVCCGAGDATEDELTTPSREIVVGPVIEVEIGIEGTYGDLLSTIDHLARYVEWEVVRPLEDPDDPMFAAFPLDDVGGAASS